jgi:hypothetical protein
MPRRMLRLLLGAAGAVVGGGAIAGWLFSAPKYRGPRSGHFDGRRFLNLEPTRHAGFTEIEIGEDDPGHLNGPAISLVASKPGSRPAASAAGQPAPETAR